MGPPRGREVVPALGRRTLLPVPPGHVPGAQPWPEGAWRPHAAQAVLGSAARSSAPGDLQVRRCVLPEEPPALPRLLPSEPPSTGSSLPNGLRALRCVRLPDVLQALLVRPAGPAGGHSGRLRLWGLQRRVQGGARQVLARQARVEPGAVLALARGPVDALGQGVGRRQQVWEHRVGGPQEGLAAPGRKVGLRQGPRLGARASNQRHSCGRWRPCQHGA
mmetsp:Transcript_38785/g.107844  ORF Transcript_38785/g.107844 Transcript_38785/m.107844 type:complete len:219 (-) Transcript_38785:126-782(-)